MIDTIHLKGIDQFEIAYEWILVHAEGCRGQDLRDYPTPYTRISVIVRGSEIDHAGGGAGSHSERGAGRSGVNRPFAGAAIQLLSDGSDLRGGRIIAKPRVEIRVWCDRHL